jgi:hypothetical protein
MESHIGRLINDNEVVHHKNENKKDNRLENLQLMTSSDHKRHHMNEQIKKGLMNTLKQRVDSSKRMSESNPYKNLRDEKGRFIKDA